MEFSIYELDIIIAALEKNIEHKERIIKKARRVIQETSGQAGVRILQEHLEVTKALRERFIEEAGRHL